MTLLLFLLYTDSDYKESSDYEEQMIQNIHIQPEESERVCRLHIETIRQRQDPAKESQNHAEK